MMQGLLGAVLAIWMLIAGYAVLGPRVEPLVTETLGIARLTFLQPLNIVTLMAAGTLLGGLGGLLARGRAAA
jgi:cell division protein FtsX